MKHLLSAIVTSLLVLTLLPGLELGLLALDPKPRVSTGVRIGYAPAGQDTLITTVSWSIVDDGKGSIDSVKVNTTGLTGSVITVKPPVGSISVTVRQGIPFGDATWEVIGQVCAFRRNKPTCANSLPVRVAVVDTPPPAPLGIVVTNVVKVNP